MIFLFYLFHKRIKQKIDKIVFLKPYNYNSSIYTNIYRLVLSRKIKSNQIQHVCLFYRISNAI